MIGVLGGMGPAATADFFLKLTAATPAARDQEHRHVIVWSDPTVPDRSDALIGLAPDPTPWLVRGANALRDAGATIVAIPCNTAHAFVPRLVKETGIDIVHMIDEVAQTLARQRPAIRTVGLLATTGTVATHLYQEWLVSHGIDVIVPDEAAQEENVMRGIRAIKAGAYTAEDRRRLLSVADDLLARGARAVIAGCTEIPLGIRDTDLPVPLVDPTQVLAEAVVRQTVRV
ncbi:aspartate/glutamate racemase family protein [Microbacterium sp. B2969]|uniref:Aspartate/glutamate racemase family protein n=1 Tax=Microbacterium alkaliflavum TaxID=3248839 RepID=A0ABW7QED7_9MICO